MFFKGRVADLHFLPWQEGWNRCCRDDLGLAATPAPPLKLREPMETTLTTKIVAANLNIVKREDDPEAKEFGFAKDLEFCYADKCLTFTRAPSWPTLNHCPLAAGPFPRFHSDLGNFNAGDLIDQALFMTEQAAASFRQVDDGWYLEDCENENTNVSVTLMMAPTDPTILKRQCQWIGAPLHDFPGSLKRQCLPMDRYN